jgi:glycosyltransferase involved in cell wall biosynthesis
MTAASTVQLMDVLLVDPSLFTGPYDAALTGGLIAAGVRPTWAVRPTRAGDPQEIEAAYVDDFFYRGVDELSWAPTKLRAVLKGMSHVRGVAKLVRKALRDRPKVVHFQWVVLPPIDAIAIALIRATCPVVLTVHDTIPYNGESPSVLQRLAFDLPLRLANALIVHTRAGKAELERRGVPGAKISVVPHGPLHLRVTSPSSTPARTAHAVPGDDRYVLVLFGELKHYKGIDILLDALLALPGEVRARARVIIAGRPQMDLQALRERLAEPPLADLVELIPRRLSELEVADLFARADCFLFPYRQVDASGVYFLAKPQGKWMIASAVGVFAEELHDGASGRLVPPTDAVALAAAIAEAVARRPVPGVRPSAEAWKDIGLATRQIYASVSGA